MFALSCSSHLRLACGRSQVLSCAGPRGAQPPPRGSRSGRGPLRTSRRSPGGTGPPAHQTGHPIDWAGPAEGRAGGLKRWGRVQGRVLVAWHRLCAENVGPGPQGASHSPASRKLGQCLPPNPASSIVSQGCGCSTGRVGTGGPGRRAWQERVAGLGQRAQGGPQTMVALG